MDQEKVGRIIRTFRKDKGMTQLELSELLGVTDRVFNKSKKVVELVEEIDGVKLVNVTSKCEKNNTMFLEFSDNDLMIQVYVNSNYISVGNHPYFGHSYFDELLKVGSSNVDVVVEFIKGYFTINK